MKIVEETPTLMKLQKSSYSIIYNYSRWLGWIFFCSLFFPIGLLIFSSGSPKTLKCNRIEPTQANCKLTSHTFSGKETTSIRKLEGAEIEVNEDSDGDTYGVILQTKEGKILLGDYYISYDSGMQEEVNKINAFINNPLQNSLIIKRSPMWIIYGIGVLIICIAVAFIIHFLRVKVTTKCILDKELGSIYLRRWGFLGVETINCKLDEIDKVTVELLDDDGGSTYDAELKLISGRKIILDLDSPIFCNHNKLVKEVVASINQFLNQKQS